jgi:HEAT repeat protein
MPLIRPAAGTPHAIPENLESHRGRLAVGDIDERRHAARALARDPAAASILAAHLQSEPDPRVRDALFASLSEIGGTQAAELVAAFIRSDDAGLRGGAIEALKRLETDAIAVLDTLMNDPDSDVRILAIEVTRAWPRHLAVPRLLNVFELEQHVNVCAAAVDVATEVGTEDLLPALDRLRERFADEPFLAFAIDTTCARIRGGDARVT